MDLMSSKCDIQDTPTSSEANASQVTRSLRHAEKRRTSTCRFADRIARVSIAHYRKTVPTSRQGLTCLATVVAHVAKGINEGNDGAYLPLPSLEPSIQDTFIVLGMVRLPRTRP